MNAKDVPVFYGYSLATLYLEKDTKFHFLGLLEYIYNICTNICCIIVMLVTELNVD